MPPKNKRNAFLVYAQSIRQQLIREGHVINNMPDLVAAAGPYWKELSEDERNVYKNLAKEQSGGWRGDNQMGRTNRRDNTGQLIVDRVDKDEMRRQKVMKERMEVMRQWPLGRDVIYERFYIISFTVMLDLRHLEIEDHEKIVPCEVSLAEYSLDQGIERTMHKFICPGSLRLGFRATAISKSENTHKIPVEGLAEEGDTYKKIYDDLCTFVGVGKRVIPPVFCKATEAEQTELALKWLLYNSGKHPVLKRVYELEGLLIDLSAHLCGQKQDLSEGEKSKATSHLTKSVFDYERGSRCSYHEQVDSKFCSLGIVKKWCYLLSDFLLDKAGIDASQNHLPALLEEDHAVASVKRSHSAASLTNRPMGPDTTRSVQPQQPEKFHKFYSQQQLHEPPQQPDSFDAERRSAVEAARAHSKATNPPTIGRGRGLMQALGQQRRPGQRPPEQRKLAAGRGRASVVSVAQSHYGSTHDGTYPQNMLDGFVYNQQQEPSARPKFAGLGVAPSASFAPQPPSEWMNS